MRLTGNEVLRNAGRPSSGYRMIRRRELLDGLVQRLQLLHRNLKIAVHPDGSQLAEIGELLKVGRIRPVIDKIFPFESTKEALACVEKGRAKGKVVVKVR